MFWSTFIFIFFIFFNFVLEEEQEKKMTRQELEQNAEELEEELFEEQGYTRVVQPHRQHVGLLLLQPQHGHQLVNEPHHWSPLALLPSSSPSPLALAPPHPHL